MSDQNAPLICECGAVMNHHADKIDYEDVSDDSVFGGQLEEVHTCPQCAQIQLRKG